MLDSSTQRLIGQYGSYDLQGLVWRDALVAEYDAISLPSAERGGRRLTVKLLKSTAIHHEGIAEDFLRDAERWLSLTSANVRALVDFGCAEDMLYVCSEPFAGRTASELTPAGLEESVARPWSLYVAHIMAEACRAAETAYHGSGSQSGLLVHGGISPHTILIDDDGVVRLDDFAFARAHARVRNTASRDTARTLPYLAPEQLGHAPALTRQVDVWSLGVCMWEMLTGRSLFLGDSDAATLLALTVGTVPAPSASNPSVPPELDVIAQRCIARNPSERYLSAGMMEADLRAFIMSRGDAIEAFELAALVRERDSLDLRAVGAHGSPGPFQSLAGYRRNSTVTNMESASGRAPGRRRHTVAIGLLSALLVMVTMAGVWIWQERPSRATLPRYEASRSSLRVAGDHGAAGAATPDSKDPGASAEARSRAGAGQIPTTRDDEASAANDAPDLGASAEAAPADTEEVTGDRSRSERRSRRSSRSGRSRRGGDDERREGAEIAAAPAQAEETRASAPGPAAPSTGTVTPAPAPAPAIARKLPVREAPPEPARRPTPTDATAARAAKASIAGVNVQGGVPRAAIQRALDRAVPNFRNCYLNASTKLGRSPAGAVSVHLVIDESNQAKVTKIGSAPLSGMEDCIRHAAARVKSQTPPDVGGVRVTFEIRFAPVR